MSKPKVVTGILSTVLCLTFASSAYAERAAVEMSLEKELYAQRHHLTLLSDFELAETAYLYAGHFENNNGRHLGFSLGLRRREQGLPGEKKTSPTVTENPEPTAMVLLGTGLAAVGALARRKNRRRAK